jgi:hypothetical protein
VYPPPHPTLTATPGIEREEAVRDRDHTIGELRARLLQAERHAGLLVWLL